MVLKNMTYPTKKRLKATLRGSMELLEVCLSYRLGLVMGFGG